MDGLIASKIAELQVLCAQAETDTCEVGGPVGTTGAGLVALVNEITRLEGLSNFFAAALVEHPGIPAELARGEFTSLRTFAREHVHQHGSRYDTNTILQRATGRGLDVEALLGHLRRRYSSASA